MATQQDTAQFILDKLRDRERFAVRAMFGEYALYANKKVVALICNDQLYVKILPESAELEALCEKGVPFPSARPHYLVDEEQLSQIENLSSILLVMSDALPTPKPKRRKLK